MKVILTKHCLQRRPHHKIRDKDEVLSWVNYFINRYHIKQKEDSVYKIKHKQNTLILKKKKNTLIVITCVQFSMSLFEIKDDIEWIVSDANKQNETFLWRINYIGREVRCANIYSNEDGSFCIKWKKNMFTKFDIPSTYSYENLERLYYDKIEDIPFIVLKDNKYFLNIVFERFNT